MEQLSATDLITLGRSNDGFRSLVIGAMTKTADGDDNKDSKSEFNEKVPTSEPPKDKNGQKQPPAAPPAAAPQEPPVAVPIGAPAAAEGPETVGARAAQAFIGQEVMTAAMQGDPAAQDIVSRTAGQVAGAVAESAVRSSAGAPTQAVPAEGAVAGEPSATGAEAVPAAGAAGAAGAVGAVGAAGAAPAPVTTPTQEIANEIAGQAQAAPVPGKDAQTQVVPGAPAGAAPAQSPTQQPGQGGESVDAASLKKIIELVRSGKLKI